MSHPMEQIIAAHLLGDTDRETTECRVTCNAAASRAISCKCGAILDQSTVVVVTVWTPKRQVIQPFCPDCWKNDNEAILHAAEVTSTPFRVECWDGVMESKE